MGLINYTLSTVGNTPDPDWEANVYAALAAIQTHTHDGINAGALLPPTSIDFSTLGFNFNNQPQKNAAYYGMAQQTVMPTNAAGFGFMAVDNTGTLYYVSPTANVPIASTSAIAYSSAAKGFLGDYGSTGGAAYYNTANATWPYNSTLYFYASKNTPTDDTGTRAGIGAGFIDLKGPSPGGAGVYFNNTSTGATERAYFGILGVASTFNDFGFKVIRAVGSGTEATAFSIRETDLSRTTLAATVAEKSRTYGWHLNGAVTDATATGTYVHSTRGNFPGAGNNVINAYSYTELDCYDGSGNLVAGATGFGLRHEWLLQGTTSAVSQCASDVTKWADGASFSGQRTFYVGHSNGYYSTPAIDYCYNSSGSVNIGFGQAVTYSQSTGVYCNLGWDQLQPLTINSTLLATGATTLQSTLAVTGAATFASTMTVTGFLTANGGSSILGSSTAPYFIPTEADTHPQTAGAGGLYRSNQIMAWGIFTSTGVVNANQFNINGNATVSGGSLNIFTIALSIPLTDFSRNVVFAGPVTNDGTHGWSCNALITSSASVTVVTYNSGSTASPVSFNLLIVGLA